MDLEKKAYIRTFGCQMNEHDSWRIRGILGSMGFCFVQGPDVADLVLFNTCTIRAKAHDKAMSEIGRAGLLKRRRPGLIVAVCGCVAQEEKGALFARFPHVDIAFGPDQIARLPELIEEARRKGRAAALDLADRLEGDLFSAGTSRSESCTSPADFVSIMKGCNSACSYCIVPKVRGREVCRPADEIVEEVRRLAWAGTKEVTLLGQNVNSYEFGRPAQGARRQGGETITFAGLLRRVAEETGIARIRFTSPHPRDVGDDLVREYAENSKLMPHIHLPLQSGSDAVLKRMRRGYTRERYREICEGLRAARPRIAITTDLIVGFCGEGRSDFEDTLSLVREIGFDSCFAFKYSPRPGTEAAERLSDDVSPAEKGARLAELIALQREISRMKNEALVGSAAMALAAGPDRMGRGLIMGRLPDNRIVNFAGDDGMIGAVVKVKVTAAGDNSLRGEVL